MSHYFQISKVTAAVKDALEKLEPNQKTPETCDIPAHEAFIKKFSQILHPKHVHIIMAKYVNVMQRHLIMVKTVMTTLMTMAMTVIIRIPCPRYPLAKMLGRMKGWEADSLTDQQLKRKQELCEEVSTAHSPP